MNRQILITDDEPTIVDVLARFLRRHNYDVFPAVGGKQAVDILASGQHIDLVITDLKMPEVTGIAVVKECMKTNIPVIVFTASMEASTFSHELQKLGYEFANILRKPIDFNVLLNSVEMTLFFKK